MATPVRGSKGDSVLAKKFQLQANKRVELAFVTFVRGYVRVEGGEEESPQQQQNPQLKVTVFRASLS